MNKNSYPDYKNSRSTHCIQVQKNERFFNLKTNFHIVGIRIPNLPIKHSKATGKIEFSRNTICLQVYLPFHHTLA